MMILPLRSWCRRVAVAIVISTAFFVNARAGESPDETEATRIAELLVSDQTDDVTKGEGLLVAQRSFLLASLLDRIQTDNADISGQAAYELGILVSPWIRGKEASARFFEATKFPSPRRPVDKVPQMVESAAIRQSLQTAVSTALERMAAAPAKTYRLREALEAFCETLGDVANDDTINWVISRLHSIKSPVQAEPLVKLVESYLGIPPTFRTGSICGNSSPDGFAAFQLSQEAAVGEAYTKLAATWQAVRPMATKERIAFSIKSWRNYFVPLQSQYSGHYIHQGWLFEEMEPLVRFGAPALDQLRAQQALETELEVKGVWEAVIATITGQEDAQLVRALFDGNDGQRELACEVVASASSKNWLPDLEALQIRSGFDQGKASQTIAVCHRNEGIPALQKGFASNPSNFHAHYAIEELEQRASRGSPKGMRRYSFR